jgi:hypothetical protein
MYSLITQTRNDTQKIVHFEKDKQFFVISPANKSTLNPQRAEKVEPAINLRFVKRDR